MHRAGQFTNFHELSSPSTLTGAHKDRIRKCLVQIRKLSQGENLGWDSNSKLYTSLPCPALPLIQQGAASCQPATILFVSAHGLKRLSSQIGRGEVWRLEGLLHTSGLRYTSLCSQLNIVVVPRCRPQTQGSPDGQPVPFPLPRPTPFSAPLNSFPTWLPGKQGLAEPGCNS